MELKIDPDLKAFIPPLSDEENNNLEKDILENGCLDPLVIWDGTIVDGHHRYAICRKHNIPFETREMSFTSVAETKLWMCRQQKTRRNLSTVAKVVMELQCKELLLEIGKQKQGNRKDQTESHNTRKIIAQRTGTSENTVQRIEKIWEVADEATKGDLLLGKITVNKAFCKLIPEKKTSKSKRKTSLEDYADEEIEIEFLRRKGTLYRNPRRAADRYHNTFEPAMYRDEMGIPKSEEDMEEVLESIIKGFYGTMANMIMVTDNDLLTEKVIDKLFCRLKKVGKEVMVKMDNILGENLFEYYDLRYDDNEYDDEEEEEDILEISYPAPRGSGKMKHYRNSFR